MNRGPDKSELDVSVDSVSGRGRSRDSVDVLVPAPGAGCAASSSLSLPAIAMSFGTGDFVSYYHFWSAYKIATHHGYTLVRSSTLDAMGS